MKAAVLHGPRDLRIEDVPSPVLGDHDVLVDVKAVGICGSDVHYYRTGRIGESVVEQPMILGHETAGVISAVGKHVKNVEVGDRVAVEPGVPCRTCEWCKTGRYNLCPGVKFHATPPIDGSLCEQIAMPADFVTPVPDHVSFEEAAMFEPLSVAIHACRRGGVGPGKTVLVTGAGPIGLVSLLAALAFGATKVFVTDLHPHRRQLALDLGAEAAFPGDSDVAAAVLDHTDGRGVDVAIECAGAEVALSSCLMSCARGGQIVVVGLGDQDLHKIPLNHLAQKELDLKGIFRYVYTYPAARDLVASGRVDVSRIITHRFPFDEVETGFKYAETGMDGAVKVVINL